MVLFCPQEPSDDAVREELIRKHFASRIAELSGQVLNCTLALWPECPSGRVCKSDLQQYNLW